MNEWVVDDTFDFEKIFEIVRAMSEEERNKCIAEYEKEKKQSQQGAD